MNKMNKKMNGDGRYEFNLLYSINMLGVLIGISTSLYRHTKYPRGRGRVKVRVKVRATRASDGMPPAPPRPIPCPV